MMKTINFESLYIHGELMTRTIMNYDRLETEEYFPPKVFRDGEYSWPGDWEGRTILGLVLLSQATHREPKYLKDIMSKIPNHLNYKGYFGKILPAGCVDE